MANQYYSGQGKLYVATRNGSGQPTGFTELGNVPSLEISVEVTKFEHKESESGSRAVDLTIVQEKNGTFTMTMESLSIDNLALAFWGTSTTVAAAVGTDNDNVIAYLGKRTLLGAAAVSNVVIQDVTDVITYEFGTAPFAEDSNSKNGYVDEANGSVYIYDTATQTSNGAAANIADLDVLHTNFDSAAQKKMEAFIDSSQERWLRFEGLNTIDDKTVVIDIFKASLDPLTGYGLINEELASVEISGNVLYDNLQTGNSKFFTQVNVD